MSTLFSRGKYFKTLKSFSSLYEDFSFLALFIFWFVHQNLLPGKIHTCLFMGLTDSYIIFTECQACSRFRTTIDSVNPYYNTLKSVLLSSLFYGYVHRSPRPFKFKQVRDRSCNVFQSTVPQAWYNKSLLALSREGENPSASNPEMGRILKSRVRGQNLCVNVNSFCI